MIVVHGGPGLEHTYLVKWLSALADTRTLVFYDQEGSGRDSTSNPALTAKSAVAQLSALASSIGWDSGIGFFAHSWGTFVLLKALGLGDAHAVRETVLCSPFALTWDRFGASGGRLMARIPADVTEQIEALSKKTDDASGVALMQAAMPYYVAPGGSVPPMEFASYRGNVNTQVFASIEGFDCRDAARCLPHRTLVIYGSDDFILPEDTEELQTDSVEIVTMDHCGHFPFAEQPQEFADVIRRFLG